MADGKKSEQSERQVRLARQLRENLRRRKAQSSSRKQETPTDKAR
jgi:hypothetical protein